MAFCTKCGAKLDENFSFCPNCGNPHQNIGRNREDAECDNEFKQSKCPNCGHSLNSFVASCSYCGFEIRGVKTSESLQIFMREVTDAGNSERRATVIRNFPNLRCT